MNLLSERVFATSKFNSNFLFALSKTHQSEVKVKWGFEDNLHNLIKKNIFAEWKVTRLEVHDLWFSIRKMFAHSTCARNGKGKHREET